MVLLTQLCQLEYSHYKHSKIFWNENITRKIWADALLGQEPVRFKIALDKKYNKAQQVNNFKYLGCDNSCVNHKNNQQKLAKFAEILGILKNNFKPTLVQKISRKKCIIHWLSPFFYMEAKFGPLEKRRKNNWHQLRLNFSEQPGTSFLTTKEMKEVLKSWK